MHNELIYQLTGYVAFTLLCGSHFMLSQGYWAKESKKYLYANLFMCYIFLFNSFLVLNYAFIFFNIITSLPVISQLLFKRVVGVVKNYFVLFSFFITYCILTYLPMKTQNLSIGDISITIIGIIASFSFYLTFLAFMNNKIKTLTLVTIYTVCNLGLLLNSIVLDYFFGMISELVFIFVNLFAFYKHFVKKENINLVGSETEMEKLK